VSAEGSLQPEVQVAQKRPGNASVELAVAERDELAAELSPQVQALIERLLDGVEPLDRPLRNNEVIKFSPVHINICTLRAAGFKGTEIAKIMDIEYQRVILALNHPYGKKLIKALVPANATRVIDIRTRLEEHASDLLDSTFALAMKSENLKEVAEVTFNMLDRAGYSNKPGGAERPADAPSSRESVMNRLAAAMEGSNAVNSEVMASWIPRRPPEEASSGSSVSEVVGSSQEPASPGRESSGSQVAPETAR
jgi:hypothetical protein